MKIRIVTLKQEEEIIECKDWEFHGTSVNNWIKIITLDDEVKYYHDLSIIQPINEDNQNG